MTGNESTPIKETYSKSRRIASNTFVLFARMFVLTIINLYAVSLVLNGLGKEDYGIFHTVAGVVTTSICISGVLEISMQRFYAIAIGNHDIKKLQEIFSASMIIILILIVVILFLFETVGLWFLNNQLVIPDGRMATTQWVYQFSLFAFLFSIFQIPFTSAVFAHEEMGIYALVSTLDCLSRLSVAIIICNIQADRLFYYSAGLLSIAFLVCLLYISIGKYRYAECHFIIPGDSQLYKGILFFSGWALYGSLANVGLIQGNTILLNIFFGNIVIAAFAISLQINSAFNTLSNNLVLAFRPAMIKAYAGQDYPFLNKLFHVSNKLLLFILVAVALPIIAEMNTILCLWLGDANSNMRLFARLIIVYMVCLALNNPISIIMHATGRIKEYNVPVESVTLMSVPITWLFFSIGLPSYYVFCSMVGVCIVAHIVRLFCLRRFYEDFSLKDYLFSFILPAVPVILTGSIYAYAIHMADMSTVLRLIINGITAPLVVFGLAYLIGLNRQERQMLCNFVKNTFRR